MGIAILASLAAPAAAPADDLGTPVFAGNFESGTICAWSQAVGWSGAPCIALQITITEGGAPLADGALFNRDVVPVLDTTGGTAPITLDATLDGVPFTSGSTVTGDGLYLLEVSAEDADGFTAQRTVQFTIDTLAPIFVSVAPPEGFVTSSSTVVLSGEVSGATTLTVNGAPVVITNDLWSSDPLPLAEGAQSFLLVASDLAGNPTPLARSIVRDSLSPGVTISQPAPGVVGSSPITVAGTATDPHLAQVLVNGQAAAVAGASYSLAGLALVEGANEIVVEAFDVVGNPPGTASVAVTLDTQEPVLTFLESGLPLVDGALFNRTVAPVVVATDATQVNLSMTLNGAPFASGTPVADEGSYTLQATAVDEGGNTANLAASFVIDLTAPIFVTVLPPDNTLIAAPEIALTGEVTGAQSVTVDGLACTLTVDAFTCPSFPLADGERIFTLLARDAAGNEAPRLHRIRRDGTGPDVVITTPAEGAYLAIADVAVGGTSVDPHLAEVLVNGVLANLVGDAWSAGPISLAEGAATIEVIARDTVDNASVVSRGVTIDTSAPEVEILESGAPLDDGALFNRAVTPAIGVTDASPWTLVATLDGAPFVSGTPVASEGLHVLQATATDSAGNATTRQVSFRVDGSPPALVAISPADGFVTAEAEVHLQGQILGAETLTIDSSPVTLLGDQFIAGPYPLAEGERTFTIVARDGAGNELSRAHHVVRDVTVPTLTIQQPAASALVGTSAVQVTGQAADPHLASVAVNGVAASLSGATWVAPQVPLVEGETTLVATAIDSAGNSATVSRVVVRDSQAPALAITDPAAGSVVPEAQVLVSGSVGEPNLDRVTVQGVSAAVQGGSFSASVALVEGDNTLVARATDRLGHAAEATRLVRRDSTAPGLEIDTPEEGSRIAAESVAVSGTIAEETGVSLTVNGVAATIAGGSFSAAAVPLIEGESRLIARARDANGNEGVRTRTVVRDTVAPTLLGTEPPAGALAIALATVFSAELSEDPGPASVAGMRLEAGAGAALAATVEIVGTGLRLTPATPLPSSGLVRLVLGPGIVDLAGNALAAGAAFEFTTADATAPAAPTISVPPARFLCADEVLLAGFAEPGLWVEIAGGAGAARVRAGSDGAFSLAVPLIPGAIHRLAVTTVDDAGNRSPATEIEVVHDCEAPIVERVDANASGFAVQFSEEIEPASFGGSILVFGAAGAIDGSVELDVDLATFTAASPLPEGAIRVEVLRQPRDLAGNLLAYPWVSVFGGDAAESFFVATVIDDAVGRPLAGARARVLATNGVPPSGTGPALESTSAGDGTVSVPVPVGTHLVLFEHPDSTPVFRFVTTQAQQGADVVDPRLTPLSAAVAVGPAGGTVEAGPALSGPPAELLIPAGALADSISISLTELSEQGLPRLLPFGWSPRAAVWIGPEATEILLPATLTLPVDASPGSTVAWVHLDPLTRVWRVAGVTSLGVAEIEVPVDAAGAWVVVEADPPPFAVPAAVVGEPLGSLPTPPGDGIVGAALAFDPETVLPEQRSRATVDYTASEAAASGSTVTLSIAEELQLLDGSTRTAPPYRADLVVYRTTEGARSRFFLASSEAARRLPIELGEENVAVLPYGGEIVRGNVLGPQGGSVLDPSGDRIDIPAGALVRPTPVQLEPTAEGTLPLPVPQGFAFAGALRLDLSGETLLEPATLFLALAEPPSVGETGILFAVESPAGGDYAWRPLATITPSGSGWQSDLIVPVDLAWRGVTRGGLYLFARALTPLGFVRGTVFDVGGATFANAIVASTGATAAEWLQLSGSDGRYAYPAWVGPVVLIATKPSTGDQGSGSALLAAAGERVDLDLLLVVVRPSVVSTTPASGATGVPVGIEPVIRFSEPVERASLAVAITLRPSGGAPLAFDIHHLGSQVTLEPEASLEPETTYELVIGEGVRDLQGHGMAAPVTVSFTTQSVTLPSTVDLTRVLLYAPGTNGESRILGLPGAAPAGTLVFVENLTRLAATVSVAAEQDGSFELSIVAQVTDRLLLHVLIAGANEVVAILGPFRTADGRGAYVSAEGSIFTTIDGWTFSVPADAFNETSIVHVVPHALSELPASLPASFVEGVSFALDFGGATPDKAIELALPAPAGAPAGRPILVLREMRAAGVHGWMLHELATQEGGRLVTLAPGAAPFSAELFAEAAGDALGEAGSGPILVELAAAAPGAMLPGIAFAGNYTISWTPEPLGFLGFPTTFWNDAYVETALTGIVTVLNRAIESLLEHDAVLIPTLLGAPVAVTVHDAASGFVLYEGDFSPPPGDGGIAEIPPEVFGDTTAPHPLAGSPLRLFVLDAAEAAGGELDRGVSFLFAGDSVEITGASGSVSGGARVHLLGLDDERSSFTTAATDGTFELQAAVLAGNRYLLALGARIDAEAALEIAWSEPLGDELGAVRVLDDAGHVLGADVDFGADRSVVTITPRGGWPTDRDLRLELGPAIADASGNSWEKTLEVDFRARASQVVGHYPFAHVYDVARLGDLLFLAAGQQGLAVLDASDPSELANVMPGGLTFPLPLSDVVRALAVDPHGRVLVAGGGVANFGVLRIFDPLMLPEILEAPDPAAARGLAWRGTTIVSDRLGGTGTQLPAGTPRKVALYSDDLTSRWRVGEPAPDGLVATFTAGEAGALGTLAVSGNGAADGAPVSLRNLTRAGFARVDAEGIGGVGGFSVAIAAASGDRIELLRNRTTIAYLATLGAGVEAVDVNAFYDGPNDPSPGTSRVVGIYSGLGDSSLELCNESVPDLASALIGLDLLIEAAASPPIDVAALVSFRGIAEIESPPAAVGSLSFLTDACAEVEGSRAVRALAAAVDLPWDLNADGHVDADERERDYAFVTHATGGLLVFDLTQRLEPQLVARVRLPLVALGVAIDRTRMRAYVSGATGGLAIVDLAALATTTFVDADENGVDDRVLEVVPIPQIQPGSPAVVLPDLGLVFVGGDGGVASIAVGVPQIIFIAADGSNLLLSELAPLGVPSRQVGPPAAPHQLPAGFRIRVALPGGWGPEVKLDVAGIGPGGEPIDDAGDIQSGAGLPVSRLEGEDGVVLHRLSDNLWEEGVHWYQSDVLVAVADLRASKAYTRTERENEPTNPGWCVRCNRTILGIPESAREVLSGDAIRVSFPAAMLEALGGTYDADRLREGAATVAAVRWETAPSMRQEPAQSPSLGSGDVVPGTLLHSGELSQGAVDLAVAGRGLDFAFARTYRNQTVGGGPLGPGWDFGYRLRLRKLPTGDVELYDGRGRRETFGLQEDGTLRAPTGIFVDLQPTSEGYLLLDPAHTLVRFDEWGRLTSIADATKDRESRGNEMRFFYDAHSRLTSVLDALGREYQLDYDDAGRLTTLTDFDEREVAYSYDTEGRLESVRSPRVVVGEPSFPDGLTTTYEYATPEGELAGQLASRDNLTSVTDPRGGPQDKPFEATYTDADGDGRVDEATAETWGGHALSIAYDFAARSTVVTDRRGNPWTYQHGETGQVVRLLDPTLIATQFEIDDEGLVKKVTKPLGGVTEITYDTEGPRRSRGNALAVVVTADARGDNGSSHTLTTTYEYEGYSNQPTKITDPRGAITQIVRNEVGLPKEITEALGAPEAGRTTIAYNDYGQPMRVTNPNLHVTRYDYFAAGASKGYLQKQTVDPGGLGLETVYETDPRGNVKSVTDPRGVRHESTYNEVDWLVETKAAASASSDGSGAPALNLKTTYLHDENGNVLEERIPFGDGGTSFTRVERDYGVLNEVKQTRSEVTSGANDFVVTTLTYDENFNVVAIQHPEEEWTLQSFDPRNLLESVTRGAGTVEASTEHYVYDAEGNRTLYTNGRGFSHETVFDGFGRVMLSRDPLANVSSVAYDDGSNVVGSQRLDGGGNLLAESGSTFDLRGRPATSSTWLWSGSDPTGSRELTSSTTYDAAGNATTMVDPLNRVSVQSYDSAERRVVATDPVGNRVEWALDRAGNAREVTLVEQVEGGGPVSTTVQAAHDALGRPTTATDSLNNTTTTVYDARGNVRLAIDAEGHFTESTYDGLDRLTRTVRPEGISVDYGYDRSSRLTSYRDALNQTTSWSYDALGRKRTTTYPDATQESATYDAAGNPTLLVDANGNRVTQGFDDANRMTSRAIVLGSGVEGPTAESFAYDGLSRLTQVQSGTQVTSQVYDSLSRLASETTNGRTTTYQQDDVGNVTQQGYPSGTSLAQTFDGLNRQKTVSSGGSPVVSYGFRGGDLVASKSLGNGLAGGTSYDGARRPVRSTLGGSSFEPFTELLSWSKRNLKTAVQREDLNGQGYVVAYDGAGRLVEAAKTENPLALAPNNSTPAAATVAALPESFGYSYDAAENLLEQRPERYEISSRSASPSDGSGRNRPGSFAGQTLSWDGNGNLIRKGQDHFAWDYRNQLTRVTRDGVGEIARYEYDAFNRLTKRVTGGVTQEWVWSGWQLLERYENGQLKMRRIYGQGLDEVVRQEADGDGDGVLETVSIPVYDSIGNAVAITDASGKAIERYEYAPYGTRTIRVDLTPPVIEQLREVDGKLLLEFSEEILLQRVQEAIVAGTLTLRDTTEDEPIAITASQPVREGKQKRRRVILTPDPGAPPTALHGMLLYIEPSAMVDLFENRPEAAYEKPFVWLDADYAIDDTTPPRVELLLTKSGEVELEFSEEIDPVVASAVILFDGETRTWLAQPDGYTLKPEAAISATTHTLQIGPNLIDKAGNGLAEPFSHSITTGGEDQIVYERPDPRVTPTSTLDNLASFQGHITDPATGLVYMRNRWMDSEMGRFLSADPLGYVDGPSAYAFAGNGPVNGSDPLGLEKNWGLGKEELDAAHRGIADASRKRASVCAADPTSPICFNAIEQALVRVFGDEAPEVVNTDAHGERFYPGRTRARYVNGVLNKTPLYAAESALQVASFLERPVRTIWNPSQGPADFLQVGLVNWLDLPDATTILVVAELRLGISEISGEPCTEFVAHSQGAAILSSALSYLTPEERSRVCVTTIGPASARFPSGLHRSRHVVNLFDLFVAVPFGPVFAPETEFTYFFRFPISHSAKWYLEDQVRRRGIPRKAIIEAGK